VTWLGKEGEGATPLERALSILPAGRDAVRDFYSVFWVEGLVDPVLLELIRLRVAMLHGVQSELVLRYDAAIERGLTEQKVEALPSWPTSPLYSELERQVLRLAEQFVIDPHGVTDADVAPVRAALSSPGVVALMNAIALIDHLDRVRTALEICPSSDRALVVAAPGPGAPLY
jgi:alkylhydroperoxidase family enzyme